MLDGALLVMKQEKICVRVVKRGSAEAGGHIDDFAVILVVIIVMIEDVYDELVRAVCIHLSTVGWGRGQPGSFFVCGTRTPSLRGRRQAAHLWVKCNGASVEGVVNLIAQQQAVRGIIQSMGVIPEDLCVVLQSTVWGRARVRSLPPPPRSREC